MCFLTVHERMASKVKSTTFVGKKNPATGWKY